MSAPGTPHAAGASTTPQGSPSQQSVYVPLRPRPPAQPPLQQQLKPSNSAPPATQPSPLQPSASQSISGQDLPLPSSLSNLLNLQHLPQQAQVAPSQQNAAPPPNAQTPQSLHAQLAQATRGFASPFQSFGIPQLPGIPGQGAQSLLGGSHQALLQQLKASADLQRVLQLQIHYQVSSLLQSGLTIDQISLLMGTTVPLGQHTFSHQFAAQPSLLQQQAGLGILGHLQGYTSGQSQVPDNSRDLAALQAALANSTDKQPRSGTQTASPPLNSPMSPEPTIDQNQQSPQETIQPQVKPEPPSTSYASQPSAQMASLPSIMPSTLSSSVTSVQSSPTTVERSGSPHQSTPQAVKPLGDSEKAPGNGTSKNSSLGSNRFKHVIPESLRSSTQPPVYTSSTTEKSETKSTNGSRAVKLPPMRAVGQSPAVKRSERTFGRPRTKNRVDNLNSQEDPLRHSRDMYITVSDPAFVPASDNGNNSASGSTTSANADKQASAQSTSAHSSETAPQRRNTFFARFVEVNPAVKSPWSQHRVGRPPKRDRAKPGPKPGSKKSTTKPEPTTNAEQKHELEVTSELAISSVPKTQESHSESILDLASNSSQVSPDPTRDPAELSFQSEATSEAIKQHQLETSSQPPPPVEPVQPRKKRGPKPGSHHKPPPEKIIEESKSRRGLRAMERRSRDTRARGTEDSTEANQNGNATESNLSESKPNLHPAVVDASASHIPPPVQPQNLSFLPESQPASTTNLRRPKQESSQWPAAKPNDGNTSLKRVYRGTKKNEYQDSAKSARASGAPPPVMPLNAHSQPESDENYDSNEDSEEQDSDAADSDASYSDKRVVRNPRTKRMKTAALDQETPSLGERSNEKLSSNSKMQDDGSMECKQCGKRFENVKSVRRHMMNHTSPGRHECQNCGHRFVRKDVFAKHQASCLRNTI